MRFRHFGYKIGSNVKVYTDWYDMAIPVNEMIENYTMFCELAEKVEIEYKDVTLVKDLIAEDYKEIQFLNGKKLQEYRLRKYLNCEALIKDKVLIIL